MWVKHGPREGEQRSWYANGSTKSGVTSHVAPVSCGSRCQPGGLPGARTRSCVSSGPGPSFGGILATSGTDKAEVLSTALIATAREHHSSVRPIIEQCLLKRFPQRDGGVGGGQQRNASYRWSSRPDEEV